MIFKLKLNSITFYVICTVPLNIGGNIFLHFEKLSAGNKSNKYMNQ